MRRVRTSEAIVESESSSPGSRCDDRCRTGKPRTTTGFRNKLCQHFPLEGDSPARLWETNLNLHVTSPPGLNLFVSLSDPVVKYGTTSAILPHGAERSDEVIHTNSSPT
jgi:hypothetical protein